MAGAVPSPGFKQSVDSALAPQSDSDFWVDVHTGSPVKRQWDYLTLGPVDLPGIWQLEMGAKLDFDVAKVPITLGSAKTNTPPTFRITVTDKGFVPCRLTATGRIWLLSDWILLKAKLPSIVPKRTSSVRTLWSISHPMAALLGVDQVSITDVTPRHPVDQVMTVTIGMIQWFQQAPIYPLYSSGGAAVAPPAKAVDPSKNT